MEIELKLALAPGHTEALRRHPLLAHYAVEPPRTRRLDSTYFDTPGHLLRHHRCALRVRRVGGALVQTLKGGGSAELGLHTREEWETPVAHPWPDLGALCALVPPGPWRTLLARADLAAGLQPVFATVFERTAWQLRSANGDEVELALDAGHVAHGTLREPLCEVELELKAGDPACLFELAQALGRDVPLAASDVSKAQRGYALAART